MDSLQSQAAKPPKRKRPSSKSLTRGNSTILIGARLLNTLADFNGPASLTSIAQAAHMSPSRTYRYLRGLCDSGLLEQNEPSGLYDLGPQILSLGLKAIGRLDPIRIATAALPDLTNATGLVSVITVWGSHGPTAVRCEHGNLAAPIRIREGIALSLFKTAAGKIFLTYLPEADVQAAIERELSDPARMLDLGLDSRNRATEHGHKGIERAVALIRKEVRRDRIARSLGTQHPMYASLSAPIFDRDEKLQLAISLIGIKETFDFGLDGEPAHQLRAAARAVSQKLGAALDKPEAP
jgi:DNA-binding IclR family transcriptional regulator